MLNIKTHTDMKFQDLSEKAQMKAKSNYHAAEEVITDYELLKSVVKVTAVFVSKSKIAEHEFTFTKSGRLIKEELLNETWL